MIAFFSMEIGLEPKMPTYSGGLGVLAGDMLKCAADSGVPMVGVSLLYRKGYVHQTLASDGSQQETPEDWSVEDYMVEIPERVAVHIEGREVVLRAWRYDVKGETGVMVPVYFLDADHENNVPEDRSLTQVLYGGNARYRLCQEVILGLGGVRLLRAIGYTAIQRFHMNEGHASLLVLELMEERMKQLGLSSLSHEDLEEIRRQCVFTTHTPIDAGHDRFPMELVKHVLGEERVQRMQNGFCFLGELHMTYLGFQGSHYVNGVAKRHAELSRLMFAGYIIEAVTNGVHAATWTSLPFQQLFDRYIPGWRQDNFSLRSALSIPKEEVWHAHLEAKRRLLEQVNFQTNQGMNLRDFTIGFGRRAATYKRPDLLFYDVERLNELARTTGPLQLIFAGKAHPRDQEGKDVIKRIVGIKSQLGSEVKFAFLENYDMDIAKLMTAGVDVWLNTPQPPLEASGTSGMKAAMNGVPSLSMLDGWWMEGWIEGITGWAIGQRPTGQLEGQPQEQRARDAAALYGKLGRVVLPLYYHDHDRYIDIMRHAIALNGSFFNTQRMLQQYVLHAYL